MNHHSWLTKSNAAAQEAFRKKLGPTFHTEEDLPVWCWNSSAASASTISDHGAAILPPSQIGDSDLPRVTNHAEILRTIASKLPGNSPEFARDFLKQVIFWSHQSTDGRWDEKLERFTRWGAQSVAEWRDRGHGLSVSDSTFHRLKDALLELDLIDVKQAIHGNRKRLWIRASDRLSRFIFEDGAWQQEREALFPKTIKPATPKAAPRGLSAKHAKIEAESKVLFKMATSSDGSALEDEEKLWLWTRLTEPVSLSSKVKKAAYAPPKSYHWRRLQKALGHPF